MMSKYPKSRAAMQTKKGKDFWGDPYWTTLHSSAAAYKPSREGAFRNLVHSYTELLPCDDCMQKFKINIAKLPMDSYMRNNHDLFFWTYAIHDMVNLDHNHDNPHAPPKKSPPFPEVKQFYFSALAEECKTCKKI